MRALIRLALMCAGAVGLSACVTGQDPYAARYDSCDREAGACYADCRQLDGEERRQSCQQRCSTSADRCFANIRLESERNAAVRRANDWAFYGRYGAWHPGQGYSYGRHGRRYSYSGYGYDRYGYDRWGYDRYGYDRWGRDYHGYRRYDRRRGPDVRDGIAGVICRDGRCDDGRTGANNWGRDDRSDRPRSTPTAPDDGRYRTEDGSVFTEDGRRLRYGGITQPREQPQTNGVRPTGRSSNPTVKPTPQVTPTPNPEPRTRPTTTRKPIQARPPRRSSPPSTSPSRGDGPRPQKQ